MRNLIYFLKLWRCIPLSMIFRKYLKDNEDVQRDVEKYLGKKEYSLSLLCYVMMTDASFRTILYYRTQKWNLFLIKISKLLLPGMPLFGIDAKKIGGGMRVYHANNTIVYAESIGKNFSVYHNVSIGRGKKINGQDIPIIGDNVTVFTGAIVVGGINVGNNSQIGAGAVVVKDVPDNSIAVGNPARIIRRNK